MLFVMLSTICLCSQPKTEFVIPLQGNDNIENTLTAVVFAQKKDQRYTTDLPKQSLTSSFVHRSSVLFLLPISDRDTLSSVSPAF